MSARTRLVIVVFACFAVLIATSADSHARRHNRDGLGIRAGVAMEPDHVLIGGQGEFGPLVGPAYFVPSLDFGFNDPTIATANLDLRWYLLPVPETGIHIYGSAGPTLVLSPDTDLGLTLTAGVHIPMKGARRYNMEMRFGFGDVPDLQIVAALMFGL